MAETLNVLFIISEADPLIKIGGLGDVGGTLPIALQQLNQKKGGQKLDVRVAIPYHDRIKQKNWQTEWITNFQIQTHSGFRNVYLSQALNTEIPIYLIDGDPIRYTDIYSDNTYIDLAKYAFFSVAAVEMCRKVHWKPDIIHAHDWHAALSVKKAKQLRSYDPFFHNTKTLYTIHNLPYSGGNHPEILELYDIFPAFSTDIPYYLRNLPMAIGLDAADGISTVSNTYAQEITTPAFGHGYENFLRKNSDHLTGIVNGIMMDQWNPATDACIAQPFSADTLELRANNKRKLLNDFNLPHDPETPLFVMVGRMTYQKGVDLCVEAFKRMGDLKWQSIILGTGDFEVQQSCCELEHQFPDRVRVELRFDSPLSRKLYASGDMLLMPSRYEPCGIAQMFSMLYGCVPVACATGGLKDTIRDPFDAPEDYTGFLFNNADVGGAEWAMRRGIEYFHQPENWREIQLRGMRQDFSWEKQAMQYVNLYNHLLNPASGKTSQPKGS